MTDDRMGGIALISGTVATLITMSLHPSGHDLVNAGGQGRMALLVTLSHALAEIAMPILFLGALALARRLAAPDRFSIAALVMYGFAMCAGMTAAAVSGFVAPGLARQLAIAAPATRDAWQIVFAYNGGLNQAFARILVVASSTAIALWSVSIIRSRALAVWTGIYGLLIGPLLIIAVAPGFLKLNVHGFGLVVIAQAVWFIGVGAQMVARRMSSRP